MCLLGFLFNRALAQPVDGLRMAPEAILVMVSPGRLSAQWDQPSAIDRTQQ